MGSFVMPAGNRGQTGAGMLVRGGGQRGKARVAGRECGGDAAHATAGVEALYSGPGYLYDERVLAALERVVARSRASAS